MRPIPPIDEQGRNLRAIVSIAPALCLVLFGPMIFMAPPIVGIMLVIPCAAAIYLLWVMWGKP